MRKTIAFLLCLVMFGTFTVLAFAYNGENYVQFSDTKVTFPKNQHISGDANGDGKITAADARIALRISAKVDSLEKYNLTAEVLDVTGDGKITAADARKILRIAAKIE